MNFNELFKKDKKRIQNIIKSVTKENNEDLEQEVYLKVIKNASKYQEKGKITNWIKTITYNVSKDYLKSSHNKQTLKQMDDEECIINIADKKTPEDILLKKERQAIIIEAINSLDKKHKDVIMLFEIEGLSLDEVSKKMKCPVGTIKSRLYHAKKNLAARLKDLF